MDNIKEFFAELLFPSFCFGCRKEGILLCGDCKSTLEISEHTYCLCNKQPLRIRPGASSAKCGRCAGKKLAGLYFALPYQEKPLTRKLIHHFKYEPYVKNLAKPLTGLIIEHLVLSGNNTDHIWNGAVLTYVPSEISSLKKRGYNQSHALAKELAGVIGIPLLEHNLVKIKKTQPQMKLGVKERAENIKDAFAVQNPAGFAGKKVFLVDDVYTTGATMEECAKTLRAAGAKQVWGVAIAREGQKSTA